METKYKNRVVELVRVKSSELLKNDFNPSVHSDRQKIVMDSILESTGFADAIIGRRVGDKIEILDGHLRAELAADQEVPVLIVDLDDEEADLFLLTFDPIAAMAKQQRSKMNSLRTKALGLQSTVFNQIIERSQLGTETAKKEIEKRRSTVRNTLSSVSIGPIRVPCTPDEIAELTLILAEYGDANGSFVGFGTYLLKLIGEA
ncbi:ParB N-terminal domain-containing protein [Pirellula sp. SH-Sr6A]|uniref:ParB N-terminal domain-containing protein n=1 Tax=Pirellula sp. SH-Sr6A TaxID=1632865 RepID=UPI0011BADDC5|nr:ParB N-terminal domain-containing protein [Pirellula sp. SH-Sr6A]